MKYLAATWPRRYKCANLRVRLSQLWGKNFEAVSNGRKRGNHGVYPVPAPGAEEADFRVCCSRGFRRERGKPMRSRLRGQLLRLPLNRGSLFDFRGSSTRVLWCHSRAS